ncbi:MAG TPA: hypothetical protein VFQ72_04265 [Candidatus Paceibacterota bacterium]|nr:hypothetical protein [Candidatus Paceibacterota bacterium]
MIGYIENLRKRPEPERRRAVLWISLSITGAIALVWGIALAMRISAGEFPPKSDSASDAPSVGETISTFFDQIKKAAQ